MLKYRGIKICILITVFVLILFTMIQIFNLQGHIITTFNPISNTLGKSLVIAKVKDYKVMETEHFVIRYMENDEYSAKMTKDIAEKHYQNVCEMFGYFPEEKLDIIIYKDGKELLKNTNLTKKTPPLGVFYGGVMHILSPRLWIDNDDKMEQIFEKEGPIVHEFSHYIVDQLTKGNYPMWLTEGIALYTEYQITGFEWGKGITYDQDMTMEDLNRKFGKVDQNMAYRKAFETVKDMSDTWGFNNLVKILKDLGKGHDFGTSTITVLKIKPSDIKVPGSYTEAKRIEALKDKGVHNR